MANKKVVNLSKHRNIKLAKKIFRIIKIPIVIIVVLSALFLSARLLGNVAVSNVTDGIREIKNVFTKGAGYPHALENFDFGKVTSIGSKPFIVYDDKTQVLSPSAANQFSMQVGSGDSKIISKNGRALVYSNTSNEVILQSRTEKLGSIKEDASVVAAGLAKNGCFATSYSSGEYQSVLSVYNRYFKKVFQWNCSQEYISDIGLSDNGRNLVVTAVGTENAEIYTRILIFNIGSSQPKADLMYRGTLFLEAIYTSSDKIIAVGDNRTVILDKKGDAIEEFVYPDESLIAVCTDSDGNAVICHEEFGGAKTSVVRYSKSGKKTATVTLDGVPDCIAMNGGKTAVSSGNIITVYTASGKESKKIESEHSVTDMFWCSTTLYTIENSSIYKH